MGRDSGSGSEVGWPQRRILLRLGDSWGCREMVVVGGGRNGVGNDKDLTKL